MKPSELIEDIEKWMMHKREAAQEFIAILMVESLIMVSEGFFGALPTGTTPRGSVSRLKKSRYPRAIVLAMMLLYSVSAALVRTFVGRRRVP